MNARIFAERWVSAMVRMLLGVTLVLGLIVCTAPVATAGGALIQTTAPLSEHSEEAVKIAVVAAIDKAVRGATAMGFVWVQLQDAQVSEHEVAVEILATDEEPDADEATPSPESDESDGGLTGDEQAPSPAAPGRVPI
jgi:hypothetical protein